MSTSQQRKNTAPQQRGYGRWIRRFAIGIGIMTGWTIIGFYGYCFGFWGRNSLLLQKLFQCDCPSFSEEWRYPRKVDIIASACSYVGSILSPTGNLLYVMEGESKFADTFSSTYLLDFRTNEKNPFFIGKGFTNAFLTDDLLFLSLHYGQEGYEGGDYILDRTTGKQYPIQRFRSLRDDAFVNGELNLEVLALELRDAQDVYLINDDIIVVLKPDFRTFPERNYYIEWMDLPRYDPNGLEVFLRLNGIDYRPIPGLFQEEDVSPDGRFIARRDGIYLAGSNEKFVEAYSLKGSFLGGAGKHPGVHGWTYDSSGVLYNISGCLLELLADNIPYCALGVPQPLLLLKVPEEYLSSTPMP